MEKTHSSIIYFEKVFMIIGSIICLFFGASNFYRFIYMAFFEDILWSDKFATDIFLSMVMLCIIAIGGYLGKITLSKIQ